MNFRIRQVAARLDCRICGRCICANCSSNSVKYIDDKGAQQRVCVCTACTVTAQEAQHLRARVVRLGIGLMECIGRQSDLEPTADILTALRACEDAAVPLEILHQRLRELDQLEHQVKAEQRNRRRKNTPTTVRSSSR